MINKAILVGHLGKDPELKYTNSEKAVCSFSLATSENKDKTEWHNIVCWNKNAENAEKYLKKGSKCYIEGKIHYGSYEDKEGIKKYTTEIIAYAVKFLDKKDSPEDF